MKKLIKSGGKYLKGDKVEILNNLPKIFENKPKPIYGTVVHQDGYYVLVKPK